MLDDYEVFDAIVRAGSLSEVARNRGVSNAMISKRLARLEARLGTKLIQRTTRRLAITEDGEALHRRIMPAIAAIREAEASVADADARLAGKLRVSAPTSFGRLHIAPRLLAFLDAYPRLELDLELDDSFVDLVGARFDLAIRIGRMPESNLVVRKLAPNTRVLCASPGYIARAGAPESLRALADHRLLAAHGQLPWRLEGPEGMVTVSGSSWVRTNSSEVVRELALADGGVALRSTWDVADQLRSGELVRVLPGYIGASNVTIYAAYPRSDFVPPHVKAFVQYLSEEFLPAPPWDRG